MAYEYKNAKGISYYLHSKEVTLRGSGHTQTIYFFRKNPDKNALDDVPKGFQVVENKKTGLPVLKKA